MVLELGLAESREAMDHSPALASRNKFK